MTSIQKKNALKKKIFLTAILIVVFGCMTAIAFGETYMALMFCRIGIYTIAVSGLDILFGYTGQISFGHAAFFAVGSYTSAYFSINMGWNPIFTMLIGVVFSMIVGAVIGNPHKKRRYATPPRNSCDEIGQALSVITHHCFWSARIYIRELYTADYRWCVWIEGYSKHLYL